jgi:hypothetical protein
MAVPAPKIIVIITEDLNLQKISHTALSFDFRGYRWILGYQINHTLKTGFHARRNPYSGHSLFYVLKIIRFLKISSLLFIFTLKSS